MPVLELPVHARRVLPAAARRAVRRLSAAGLVCVLLGAWGAAARAELLYVTEGNRLRRLDLAALDAGEQRADILVHNASEAERGGSPVGERRDINGTVCALPDGSGRFIAGEDTGQPHPPPGWGVFAADGTQIGKLTATYRVEQGEPYGCAFAADGRLFTTEIGNRGLGRSLGQLILWFPPFDHFPGPPGAYPETDAASANFCKLATDIGTSSGIAIDSQGRVYVSSSSRGVIHRFSPPFPTGPDAAGGCGTRDELGSPLADVVQRDVFASGLHTFSGLAFGPDGHLYAASVFTGEILEFDAEGREVRTVLAPGGWLPPFETGNPQGIAFDSQGRLYYADLDLVWSFPGIGPGGDGKLRRIRFDDDGRPLPPEILIDGLAFPDGVAVHPGALPPGPSTPRAPPASPR